jgi:ectoine hydroxylase-related dioxygenase (phytanoyl-CoA dioxygenase family)
LAVSAQYCEPFVRQQENQQLCVDFATAITLSAGLQSLMGWSIHPPFIGQVDGRHPLKRLEQLVGRGGADSEVQVEPAASATVTYQARL